MDELMWTAMDKKEVQGQLDEINQHIEHYVQPAIAHENWYVYTELRDLFEHFKITLKQKGLIN